MDGRYAWRNIPRGDGCPPGFSLHGPGLDGQLVSLRRLTEDQPSDGALRGFYQQANADGEIAEGFSELLKLRRKQGKDTWYLSSPMIRTSFPARLSEKQAKQLGLRMVRLWIAACTE